MVNFDAKAKGKAILIEDDNDVPTPPRLAPSAHEQVGFENAWCSTKILLENHSNFKKTGSPVRFMYCHDESWLDFPAEVVNQLQTGFNQGMPMIEVKIGCARFLFDLYRMVQVDLESGKSRSISWTDVNGKCFFPKTFIDEFGPSDDDLDDNPTVKVLSYKNPKIGIGSNPNPNLNSVERKRKRKREVLEPENCSKPGLGLGLPKWSKTRLLVEGEPLYKTVMEHFMCGIGFSEPNVKITAIAIHQCVRSDPIGKARAMMFFNQVKLTEQARGGEANVTFGWYGTSVEGVKGILTDGFVASKIFGSQAHGIGVYLSPLRSPHMSLLSAVDDYGEKHLVLCRIVLGRQEQIRAGSQRLYRCVDHLLNPKWYIMWCDYMNTRILPECIVSFKYLNRLAGGKSG